MEPEAARILKRLRELRATLEHLRGTSRRAVEGELRNVEREMAGWESMRKVRTASANARAQERLVNAGEALKRAEGYAAGAERAVEKSVATREAVAEASPETKLKPGWRKVLDQVKVLRKEAEKAADAGDMKTFREKMSEAEQLEGYGIEIAPRSKQQILGIWKVGKKYAGLAAGIGAWKLGWWIWDWYRGDVTSFPAFIGEESAQTAASNLWGFTDKDTVNYMANPRTSTEQEFREWLATAEDMMTILEAIAVANEVYINSRFMKMAPLARPSYVMFALATRAKIRSNRYILDKVVRWRGMGSGTVWEPTSQTEMIKFGGIEYPSTHVTWRKAQEGLPIRPTPAVVWELRDSRDMVGEAFKSLIGASMATDALIKSEKWDEAKLAYDAFANQVAIAEALYQKLKPDLVALDEEWDLVYQALVGGQRLRLRAMDTIIKAQAGRVGEEGQATLSDLDARIERLKQQTTPQAPPGGGGGPEAPRAPEHGGGLTTSEKLLLGK